MQPPPTPDAVDDGTGVIMCYYFLTALSGTDWRIGSVVQVKGRFYATKDQNGADQVAITVFNTRAHPTLRLTLPDACLSRRYHRPE